VTNLGLTRRALTNALLAPHLSGSDTSALGGDLAYRYGQNGSLAGMGVAAAEETLADADFGSQAQPLASDSAWPMPAEFLLF
jgi:hypothetical protein